MDHEGLTAIHKIGTRMKRICIAILGLTMSISLAPAVQAQSLNFGSLGSTQPEEDSVKDWTEGVKYSIYAGLQGQGSFQYCEINFRLDRMSAYDIPRGHIGWVDTATGKTDRQSGDLAPLDWNVPIMAFPTRNWVGYNVDFVDTVREMSFFIIEEGTNKRIELGSDMIRFDRTCPVPPGMTGTATQKGTLYP